MRTQQYRGLTILVCIVIAWMIFQAVMHVLTLMAGLIIFVSICAAACFVLVWTARGLAAVFTAR